MTVSSDLACIIRKVIFMVLSEMPKKQGLNCNRMYIESQIGQNLSPFPCHSGFVPVVISFYLADSIYALL